MEVLDKILERMRWAGPAAATPTWSSEPEQPYRCPRCRDRELVDRGDGVYVYCDCRRQKIIERRIKSSHIDPSFAGATFDNFQPAPHSAVMLQAAREYAANFQQIRTERHNGLGFLARVGESAIKEIRDPARRQEIKAKHNSYGLGKTHLLTAVGMTLLEQGVQVLMVNDADIVAELRQGQMAEDSERFENMMSSIERAELLIWDDLGKAKSTEWVLNQYYRIINYRYRMGLPTCFSTNEDTDTLAEKIGDATASRLFAMCRGRLITCEGPDYRLS